MNRQEMVVRIAYRRALAQEQVAVVIQDFLSEVKGAVGRGESVQLRGFGTFCPRERKARRGRDMGRGVAVAIPARRMPAFRPADEFCREVEERCPGYGR
ncbi:HU family DNA-binding protein [Gallalistipes aquisgranensis]|uniref:HU family DNA-binding protein n=1 Tax=Gallalistipes aquisgranensis TaxID=2779358 RepID=UPI001CF8F6D8|nr:HU family DNA-binding protein [Gallalistipes aquisgranensis]MBE5033471.1 HU family DNA-binding protein [Gallalistipes aquisgranensis]